jgi:DNA-binding transcriptional regulator/RsmH inhibitor MraZ
VTRGADGSYYFRWVMDVRMKKVARGETIRTPGITLVRFDEQGRVLIHQDYWDSAAGLWEHVPVLGRGIRTIKARL